jgi:hypothetical protein
MRTPEADDGTEIKNVEDLMTIYGGTYPDGPTWSVSEKLRYALQQFARNVYKNTNCGAWTTFVICKLSGRVLGVEVGSIVEGSQAEVPGKTLFFPFTLGMWRDLITEVEEIAAKLYRGDETKGAN